MEKNNPRVSVIIPVYNVESYLKRCLDSVLNQKLKKIEVLVVNDGSTDGSQKIIDHYVSAYPQVIKAFYKENGGLSSARNYALDKAQGEYITFLDSDDYIDPDYLYKLYRTAKRYNSDMVCSGQRKVDEAGKILKVLSYPVKKNPNTILRRLNISGKIYKREYIEKHHMRFAAGKIYEDDPFNLVMLFLGKNFRIIPYEGYNQVVRNGSITSKKIDVTKVPFNALESSISYVTDHREEVKDFDVFEFTVLSFFTYFIFQANKKHLYLKKGMSRKSDLEDVLKFCKFTQYILKKYLPEFDKNKNISIFKNRDLQFTQRLGVWLFVKLCKYNFLYIFTKLYYYF